ncbi:ComEC/Rec2 family competence protein [Candidatus Dependentiae bacterium]|nr:ComEC/Rec2 family competence protein [Candidatus Dependentiae bacterium]
MLFRGALKIKQIIISRYIYHEKPIFHWSFYALTFYSLGIIYQSFLRSSYPSHYLLYQPELLLIGIVILIIFTSICIIKQYKKKFTLVVLLPTTSLCGAFLYYNQQIKHKNFQDLINKKKHTVIGEVTDIEQLAKGHLKTKITLKIKNMLQTSNNTTHQTENSSGKKITLYTQTQKDIQVGDVIKIANLLFKKIKNESFNNYLIKEHIAATTCEPKLNYIPISRATYSLTRWLHQKKNTIFSTLKNKINKKHFTLVAKIFFGNNNTSFYYTQQTKEQGKRWGIAHYFARSGLHLIIFILLWNLLFRLIPAPFTIKQIAVVVMGIIYFLLSWPSTSFNRAFSTFLLYKFGTILRLQTDFLHLLTLVCLVTLVLNPTQLFFLDFQLSFGLTLALALLNRSSSQKI